MVTKTREITLTQSKGAFTLFKKQGLSKQDYDFEGVAALRHLLSNEKARLLQVIKSENPESIYSLAKLLGRNFKSVLTDVRLLQRFGFIEITSEKTQNRTRHKPILAADTITIHLKF